MKFAQVGYGHDGRGDGKDGVGYTYVVNDNVRVGQQIGIAVKHVKSKKIFGTTGQVLETHKNLEGGKVSDSLKDNLQRMLEEKGENAFVVTRTSREMGLPRQRGSRGTFEADKQQRLSMERNANTALYEAGATMTNDQVKAENANKAYVKKHQTFEEYSKPFMGEGENGQ